MGDPAPGSGATIVVLPCADLADRYACGAAARAAAFRVGFAPREAAEIALCAAELASNAARHGRGGRLEIRYVAASAGIELRCIDSGPGFSDADRALVDGWSRGRTLLPDQPREGGLGTGLGAVSRLMHELDVSSTSEGAVVIARRFTTR